MANHIKTHSPKVNRKNEPEQIDLHTYLALLHSAQNLTPAAKNIGTIVALFGTVKNQELSVLTNMEERNVRRLKNELSKNLWIDIKNCGKPGEGVEINGRTPNGLVCMFSGIGNRKKGLIFDKAIEQAELMLGGYVIGCDPEELPESYVKRWEGFVGKYSRGGRVNSTQGGRVNSTPLLKSNGGLNLPSIDTKKTKNCEKIPSKNNNLQDKGGKFYPPPTYESIIGGVNSTLPHQAKNSKKPNEISRITVKSSRRGNNINNNNNNIKYIYTNNHSLSNNLVSKEKLSITTDQNYLAERMGERENNPIKDFEFTQSGGTYQSHENQKTEVLENGDIRSNVEIAS